jgi:isopentenyl-diphosphate delta-isomerase
MSPFGIQLFAPRTAPPSHPDREVLVTDDRVILVDDGDALIGTEDKSLAHRLAKLHRAVSVCLVNDAGALLLQRRAAGKYHSANLWSNTCCGHPRPGEATVDAARRRLREEMGVDCDLSPAGTLRYWARVGAGMFEHEIDHLYFGVYGGPVEPDPAEVSEIAWVDLAELADRRARDPREFTAWFFPILDALTRRAVLPAPTPG